MIKVEANRLILKTNCTITDGCIVFPEQSSATSLLKIQSTNTADGGFSLYLKSGEYIGHISILFKRKPYELSFGIEEPYRKKGYMNEAMTACTNWIFDNCSTNIITALVGSITPLAVRKILTSHAFIQQCENDDEWWVLYKEKWNNMLPVSYMQRF